MTTNEHNGHLPATPIDVEPTVRQLAAHELLAAFNDAGKIDWDLVEANFRTVAEAGGYDSPVTDTGRAAAARINEALLAGQEVLPADLDAVRYAIEQARSTKPLELVDGLSRLRRSPLRACRSQAASHRAAPPTGAAPLPQA